MARIVGSLTQERTSRCDFCSFEIQWFSTCVLWHRFKMSCDERRNGGQQHLWERPQWNSLKKKAGKHLIFTSTQGKNLSFLLMFNLPLKKNEHQGLNTQRMIYLDKLMNRNSLIPRLRVPSRDEKEFHIPETKSTQNKNQIRNERQVFLNPQTKSQQ